MKDEADDTRELHNFETDLGINARRREKISWYTFLGKPTPYSSLLMLDDELVVDEIEDELFVDEILVRKKTNTRRIESLIGSIVN